MTQQQRHAAFWFGLSVVLAFALATFKDILLPFLSGLVFAYFLNPAVDALDRRGMPRWLASIVIVGLLMLAFALAAVFLFPVLAAQVKALALALPGEIERFRVVFENFARERLGDHFPAVRTAIADAAAEAQSGLSGMAGTIVSALWNRSGSFVTVLSLVFVTPLLVYYLLVDWHRLLDRIEAWLPREHEATIRKLALSIDQAVSAFIRGQGLICLILGCLYLVGLSLVGLKYGALIGVGTGLMSFVPVVGWAVGTTLAVLTALSQFGLDAWKLLAVAAVMVCGTALETAVLGPKLVGPRIGLHPVWLIFSLFAFSYLLGFVGTLVAVPLAAACGVLVRHALSVYLESEMYLGRPSANREPPP